MANPYAQVALTYVRHAESWARIGYLIAAVVIVLSMLVGPGVAVRFGDPEAAAVLLFAFLVWSVPCLLLAIVAHSKEQFADSRAHLTPGFRRAHARVATALALTVAVLLPAALTLLAGLRSVSLVAVSVFLLGAVLWLVLWRWHWVCYFLPGIWGLGIMHDRMFFALGQLASGQFEVPAIGLLILGAAATVLGAVRLFGLNEEMPEYRRWIPMGRAGMTGMACQQQPREGWLKCCSADKQMARLTEHARRAATSRWSRVCRWAPGVWTGWYVPVNGLYIFLLLLALPWMFGTRSAEARNTILPPFFLIFMPAVMSITQLIGRKLALVYELLMPVERTAYLRQVGAAAAIIQFQIWVANSVGVVLWWLIAAKQAPQFIPMANLLIASALWQVWIFGVIVWAVQLARNRFRLWAGLVPLLALVVSIVLTSVMYEPPLAELWRMGLPVAVAALFAAVGVLLTWHAYRRWLVTDLD